MNKKPFFFLLPLFFCLIGSVKADTFQLLDVPTYVDNLLGVGTFIGGLLASLFVLMFILLPIVFLTKGKYASVYIIVGLTTLAPLIALGWFPVWVYIIMILLIAIGYGEKLTALIGGLR